MHSRCRSVMGSLGIALALAALSRLNSACGAKDASAGMKLVYHTDFSGPVGDEWSHKSTGATPKGKRKFLGKFIEEPVVLALRNLPEHQLLRVTFDVFFIRSWDGNSPYWGTKIWDCGVVDGPTLIHSTFCNCGFFSDNNEQSFPDVYPSVSYPAWTGAVEHGTLGFIQSWGGLARTFSTDSVYHFALAFPHHEPAVGLRFTSIMKGKKDKSWGLANMQVETLDHLCKHEDKVLADLWDQLGGKDPVAAFGASWALIASGDQAVDYVQKRLLDGMDDQAIARLIVQLDDDDFAVREQASRALEQQRPRVLPLLRKALETATSGEVRGRLEAILKGGANGPSPETLRLWRVDHLLQVIGTPGALRLRATLGVPAPLPEKPAE